MGNNLTMLKLLKSKQFKPGSVIIITGATSGVGKEVAFRYAERKSSLVLSGRNAEELTRTKTRCESLGAKVITVQSDVTREEDCKRVVDACMEHFGRIDILFLSAGVTAYSLFDQVNDLKMYDDIMKTNFFGYLNMTKLSLPHLKRSHGQIAVMSSMSGELGLPYRSAYCASKFAVTGFFEALRLEVGHQVDITLICPPSINTNLRDNSIMKATSGEEEMETSLELGSAVDVILDVVDRKARKVYFPFKMYFAVYFRPFFPDQVDNRIKRRSKL